MAFSLREILRQLFNPKKERSAFASEKEAYEFCQQVYRESGGVPPELRRAYENYRTAIDDDCRPGSESTETAPKANTL